MVSEEGEEGKVLLHGRSIISTNATSSTAAASSSSTMMPGSSSGVGNNDDGIILTSDGWDPAKNQDEAIKAQEQEIEREIAERNSLIGDKIPLDVLLSEYQEEDQIYRNKIHDLKSIYGTMRKSRPDGNCFFRAFGFSLFNSLLADDHEIDRVISVAHDVHQDLHDQGFSFTVDDFHDVFLECLTLLRDHRVTTPQQLLSQIFNDASRSDYIVVFLRLITSSHLQKNSEFFQAFIEDGLSVKEFCSHEVEPMYKESDHIHVIAITTSLSVGVRINYLDRGGTVDKINVHDFPEGVVNPQIHLLYRPGHYDVLYPLNQSNSNNNKGHHNESSSFVTSSSTSASGSCPAAGQESSDSCGNVTSQTHQQQQEHLNGSGNHSAGESSDQYQDQSDVIGSNSNNHGIINSRHHVTSSSSTPSSPATSPNNHNTPNSNNSSSSHHHHQDKHNHSGSSSEDGTGGGGGVSSSKNPRLDPGVSSSESDSNEPASSTTTATTTDS